MKFDISLFFYAKIEVMKDIAVNKKAYHDFEIIETVEAGMVLTGSEIKSIRAGRVSLKESFVSFTGGEAFVKGMNIAQYKDATYNNHDEARDRKLLMHKREITKYFSKCKLNGLTMVPLKMYFNNGKVKMEVALARGKTLYDKRQTDKERSMERAAKQAMKR